MSYSTEGATPNLLWTAYQPSRELSHLVVLPKSMSEFVVDALTCPHFDSRAGVTKNLCLFEIAFVLVCFDHVAPELDSPVYRSCEGTYFPFAFRNSSEIRCLNFVDAAEFPTSYSFASERAGSDSSQRGF